MLRKLIFAAAALALSAPVLADRGHRGYDKQYWKRQHRPVVVVPSPHVYYAPPPRVYYAPPPVYYRPPVPQNGISVRLHFPF